MGIVNQNKRFDLSRKLKKSKSSIFKQKILKLTCLRFNLSMDIEVK